MAVRYKELFEVELAELMKKEFSGDFGLALKFLALPLDRGMLLESARCVYCNCY